jgi:hypothetical protein
MEIIHKLKDVVHHVAVWFVTNTLPEAKKQYAARPGILQHLDVGAVAAKAALYGESVDAEEMVRYVNRYINLCAYLVADGYSIENALFRTQIRVPGEYDGTETALPDGLYAEPRINISPAFRNYAREHVKVDFMGVDETNGHMFTFLDEVTGSDSVMTPGNLLHIHGTGMKIAHDDKPEHVREAGLWFVAATDPTSRTRAMAVAINEPRRMVGLTPSTLPTGEYYIEIITQVSVKGGGKLLKDPRAVRSEQTLECKPQH